MSGQMHMREGEASGLWWRVALSALFHLGLALIILVLPAQKHLQPVAVQSVTVEIVPEFRPAPSFKQLLAPEQSLALPPPRFPATAAGPAKAVSPQSAVLKSDGMVRATVLYSAQALSDRRSRKALYFLRHLGSQERMIQLCNTEAMEQVHHFEPTVRPDFLVAYALADPKITGQVLQADGGAMRSRHQWYKISYKCEVSVDLEKVASFAFKLGEKIPRSDWASYYLTADDGGMD